MRCSSSYFQPFARRSFPTFISSPHNSTEEAYNKNTIVFPGTLGFFLPTPLAISRRLFLLGPLFQEYNSELENSVTEASSQGAAVDPRDMPLLGFRRVAALPSATQLVLQ